eukprot:TRINITY_DN1431_c0_g1_i1.p1 TRINITY_DN1431_c0_g1~~TRINITY_DN1431_c0_g1_i1.p1  ORF type:complete len:241 (-),score=44.64 TRINITY_DN1431_c0_g1_i1:89-775(-)
MPVKTAASKLSTEDIAKAKASGELEIAGEKLLPEEYSILRHYLGDKVAVEPNWNDQVLVLLDVYQDAELLNEGYLREVINRVQRLRKTCGVLVTDDIQVFYDIPKENPLRKLVDANRALVQKNIDRTFASADYLPSGAQIRAKEEVEVNGCKWNVIITWRTLALNRSSVPTSLVKSVEYALSTSEFKSKLALLKKDGQLVFKLDEAPITLKFGKDIFESFSDLLEATK